MYMKFVGCSAANYSMTHSIKFRKKEKMQSELSGSLDK